MSIGTSPKRHLALRVSESALARIDQLAAAHGLTRTDYMVRASIGELQDPLDLESRFQEIEHRVANIERMAGLGAFD